MDFTYSSYTAFVSELLQNGYQLVDFGPPSTLPPLTERFVVLRHDVDVSLRAAVRFAEHEADHGIRSSYFVMITNQFYNAHSSDGRRALGRLRSLGHSIGLHFDETIHHVPSTEAFNEACSREAAELMDVSEGSLVGVSFHRPISTRLGATIELTAPLPHSYLPAYIHDIEYCSDSTGRWRFGPPNERPAVAEGRPLHLLTHPIWWGEQHEAPEERLGRFVQRHQAWLVRTLAGEVSVVARDSASHEPTQGTA